MLEKPQIPMNDADISSVKSYLLSLQDRICRELKDFESEACFCEDIWDCPKGSSGRSRAITGGDVIEKGGVNFSHVVGENLPPSATVVHPEFAGGSFETMGVSLVIHPNNPFAPTSHANVRLFLVKKDGVGPLWWFGGGFDLTPYYGFNEDCIHWHQTAYDALKPFGSELYPKLKAWCDEYFYLKHRQEPRGIGGLFYDDFNEGSFEHCFGMMCAVGDAYSKAYLPILERRKDHDFNAQQRDFQLHRRGRYVEFNLVFDRGTLFGLQSGVGRTESILVSLPPEVRWTYCYDVEPKSEEAKLTDYYLTSRDWLAPCE